MRLATLAILSLVVSNAAAIPSATIKETAAQPATSMGPHHHRVTDDRHLTPANIGRWIRETARKVVETCGQERRIQNENEKCNFDKDCKSVLYCHAAGIGIGCTGRCKPKKKLGENCARHAGGDGALCLSNHCISVNDLGAFSNDKWQQCGEMQNCHHGCEHNFPQGARCTMDLDCGIHDDVYDHYCSDSTAPILCHDGIQMFNFWDRRLEADEADEDFIRRLKADEADYSNYPDFGGMFGGPTAFPTGWTPSPTPRPTDIWLQRNSALQESRGGFYGCEASRPDNWKDMCYGYHNKKNWHNYGTSEYQVSRLYVISPDRYIH
jgi:hypothetical protein